MTPRIHLIRHGRSAHVVRGWLDADALQRWLAAYDEAGIADAEAPPDAVRALARSAGVFVDSDLPRARASAAALAPELAPILSPLLRETALPLPTWRRVRLPFAGWALVVGAELLSRRLRRLPADPETRARAATAAAWLAGLVDAHGSVVGVTHAGARGHVAAALCEAGWRVAPGRRRSHHWSVWTLTRGPACAPRATGHPV